MRKPTTETSVDDCIYYDFLSSLVNNDSYNPTESMINSKDLYRSMEMYISMEILSATTKDQLQLKRLKLGFNKGLFQRTLNRIIIYSREKSVIHKVSKKSGLSYKINYAALREYLVETKTYNDKYESSTMKHLLPSFIKASLSIQLSSSTCKNEIYKKYLKTLCFLPGSGIKKIYGFELFKGMKEFVRAKLTTEGSIKDENVKEMYVRYENGINVTRFGRHLNEILLFGQCCYADKIFTNKGTQYSFHLKELEIFCDN
jgi:hypothetical protein